MGLHYPPPPNESLKLTVGPKSKSLGGGGIALNVPICSFSSLPSPSFLQHRQNPNSIVYTQDYKNIIILLIQ